MRQGKTYDIYSMNYKEFQKDWQSHVQEIADLLNFYKIGANATDTFLNEYDKLVVSWNSSQVENKNEMSFVYEQLVIPLRNLAFKYAIQDVRAFQLNRELNNLRGAYQEMTNLKSRHSEWFTSASYKVEGIEQNLQDTFSKIDELPTKSKLQFRASQI